MKKYFVLLVSSFLVAACSKIPNEAYSERGTPQSLLDVSSEMVNVEISSEASIDEIKDWIEQDQPSRAVVSCANGDVLCGSAADVLDVYGVDYEEQVSDYSEVSLVYERIIARDCNNTYIDNRINPYNLNHPSFGCSTASNIVQMVTNRQEFVNPSLLGYVDGRSALRGIRMYRVFDAKTAFTRSNSNGLSVGSINFGN
jgi:type IV pilus biogenesis protein CpaD/CtpE